MRRKVQDRKIPFNCYLTLRQLEQLDDLSEQEDRPKAELVREAVGQYLARKEQGKTP